MLTKGGGSDVIVDFQEGQDLIALTGGVQFAQLAIAQGNGATTISLGSEVLASINGVAVGSITEQDFTTI